MKKKSILAVALVLVTLAIGFSSCNKDDETANSAKAAYYGRWTNQFNLSAIDLSSFMPLIGNIALDSLGQEILTISDAEFTQVFKVSTAGFLTEAFAGKGSIEELSDSTLKLQLTALSSASSAWHSIGTPEFESLVNLFPFPLTENSQFTAKYQVFGDTLKLQIDFDNNNIYSEEYETRTYASDL